MSEGIVVSNVLVDLGEGQDSVVFDETSPYFPIGFGPGIDTVYVAQVDSPFVLGSSKLSNLERIDAAYSPASSEIVVDQASILDATGTVTPTIAIGLEDRLLFSDSGWQVAQPQTDGLRRYHQLVNDLAIVQLDDSLGWHNPLDSLDVNRDGVVSAVDALALINLLGQVGPVQLIVSDPQDADTDYVDSSGDGNLTSLDALLVINALNRMT